MKRILVLCAVITVSIASAWVVAKVRQSHRNQARDEDTLTRPTQAPGRIEYVTEAALIATPEKYTGKRVILSGIWKTGFEISKLELGDGATPFKIWVEANWQKIDEPMGDLSNVNKSREEKLFTRSLAEHRVIAEGTFYGRTSSKEDVELGFGHLANYDGLFYIDRLYQYEATLEK